MLGGLFGDRSVIVRGSFGDRSEIVRGSFGDRLEIGLEIVRVPPA